MTGRMAGEDADMATEDVRGAYSPIGRTEADSLRVGDIEISSDVIAAIAAQAAKKVEGVVVIGSSFSLGEFFGREKTARKGVAVKTDQESGHVVINVDISVRYGLNIYETARHLQLLVKEEVEALTGSMNVEKTNVRVRKLIMPEDEEGRETMSPDRAVDEEPLADE